MSVEEAINSVRNLWMDTVIADGSKADYNSILFTRGFVHRAYLDLNVLELVVEDKVVDRVAIGVMPDPENYLFQPIRAAVIDKKKLLSKGFVHAHKVGYNSLWVDAEKANVNELQIVGYFAAKKMEDNNVHIAFSLCVPDDYKRFTKEKAMIFLYDRFLNEPQYKIIKNRLVFDQKSYTKMNVSDMEGDAYIYHFSRKLVAQYRYFERRVIKYFKLENRND